MPLYKYKAVDRDGKIRSGNLDAVNDADLEKRLLKLKLELIRAAVTVEKRASIGQPKVDKRELILFCVHMGQLTRSGVPLMDGLTDLRDSMEHPRFKEVVANLIERIEGGSTLSEALEEYPKVFDTLFINLVRAGEASGQLPNIFDSLADMIKWQDELSQSTKKLLVQPAFVGGTVLGVTVFLMVYLVPQLVEFIVNSGEELPGHTRALIAVSEAMTNYWYVWLIVPPVLFILIKMSLVASEKARYQADSVKLRVWQIGPVLKKITLSRFANFFSMLYAAGIPVLRSLEIAEGIVDNKVIRGALSQARQDIEQGEPISQSLAGTGMFPPLVLRMLKIGETTGQLDKALLNVSYFYERDIKDSIDKIQSLIQPTMTAVLGLLLGWVMLSVLSPIYGSLANVQL
ncbi:MAG: type II secretion system F family protein [Porticoccaceae bacterium]|jgi:type IV pilus assembly protein PilC|nr:type II secretion system F family protein [Porticoccaceae bacterium]